ncbi:TIGR03621 family F420-dependent LLM class oxidoreductase [Actinomadura alba]|uniref:TIGR03621 family F420-dependent LLM class oxidoreductase n=1 Tax=Actinomadura alba TaxID=406431 RepID=A0ABR7LTK3_9ACTN|nr:TIGR03621 family F420-dependent LLM class oxidoreductase [Actinomadura alba]MBC6468126.1 TIGR03621 family F420-dependent LLM class oxidoreductase [Actinomadura alba]
MADFRFGFNVFGIRSRRQFVERCRTAEAQGYDIALAPDHLGAPAPFPVLIAAAEATERLRVGTLVLNVGFWNSHLLAREVATADLLTDGRLELGLGSGHMRWEFEAAGIEWEPFAARADRLERTIEELGRLFGGPDYEERAPLRDAYDLPELRPVQRKGFGGSGPPLLVGGTGDTVLRLAARHADTVGHAGAIQVKGRPPGTFRLATAAEMDERVRFVREQAGPRADEMESNVLVQMVAVTPDRRSVAEHLVSEQLSFCTVEEALDTPLLLIGTEEQIAEQLRENRERYGFTYITVHEPFMAEFAPVIERLRSG